MSNKLVTKVFKKLNKTPKTQTSYDVIIYVGEEPDCKEFHADSKTLRSKSDHFKKLLSAKDVEKNDEKYVIKKPNITPQIFNVIIKYLSNEDFNLTDKSGIEILNIIIVSDDLKLNQLTKFIKTFFINNNQQFLRKDPIEILQTVNSLKIFNNIQSPCLDTIVHEPEILFNSTKFNNLPVPLLEVILKREDLNVDEIELWENLIKWGLAQEKTLDKDVSKWRQEEFDIFKRILHKFIPLIKFYGISSEDYFNKIRPYEEILPKELRDEILKFHMIPGYEPTLNVYRPRYPRYYGDSVLINRKHIITLVGWINKNQTFKLGKSNSYSFRLLYRDSRDGKTPAAFHAKCDNKGATIVIVKISNSEQIVGGYNPLQWDSNNAFKSTKDSFIFSSKNSTNFQKAKVSYSNGYSSVGGFSTYGPVFGNYDLAYDAYNNTWQSNSSNSYPKIDIPTTFNASDYEVFQVTRK
ncbi:hypothetical protein C1645_829361 [Glomus cerebriforme]|uniref:Uncharacterized protein n=1 Tax=Glomus cerebriforme TaxID=658196 RepID=A0A397SJS9_9GLOM|nr:hypothetical protein C1645_829361 [Glomus cerebriforme]